MSLSSLTAAAFRKSGHPELTARALSNLGAQGGALASVSVASLFVARSGGPTVVGEYSLLRVLPWLLGVILSCGLPTATAFFLAGEHSPDRRLRPTLSVMAVAGSILSAVVWLACAGAFHGLFFSKMPLRLVVVTAIIVVTQLCTVTAKGCCQGSRDIRGANLVIVAEELWFVFCYPAVIFFLGSHGIVSVLLALIISGTLAALTGLLRLLQRGFFSGWGRPSLSLMREIAAFGARGQLGNLLWLTNLRFDFLLLDGLAGPAVLGIYAVASKFAELMRLAPTAINYVLYPRFRHLGPAAATAEARRLLPRVTALTVVMTPVVALATLVALPVLYGTAFRGAVLPAEIIIVGLSIEGAAAVASAFLLGGGRPGLNSVGMGVGATITVTLDLILIPRYGALGGALTSAITYLTTTAVLTWLAYHLASGFEGYNRRIGSATVALLLLSGANLDRKARSDLKPDTMLRRLVDVTAAGMLLLIVLPVLLLVAVAVRVSSRGPVVYRQVRAGKWGHPFTMMKFRSMVSDADSQGPLVSTRADPRITRVGAWLRATKLDELPQLLNVVKGDMTLIGPRPEVPRYLHCYRPDELGILRVRPGLTGPGQIFYTTEQAAAGEAEADPEWHYVNAQLHPKLAVDLDYLRRRGLWVDIGILVRTALLMCGARKQEPFAAVTRDASLL